MSYILNMLLCVCMILLDNLLQCLLFIAMIDLSRTCDSTVSLICYALVIFTIYFWIKIKLKVLIYLTNPTLRVQLVLVETSLVKPKTGKERQSKRARDLGPVAGSDRKGAT
jgi:hypothetical protein